MRKSISKGIFILLFTILFAGCCTSSKVSSNDDVTINVTMHGIEVDINEDVSIGTLLSQDITLSNVTMPLSAVTIDLSGEGSEDFGISIEAGATANSYLGKVTLLHALDDKGGTLLELNATATANGQNIGSVPVKIHILDVPQKTIVMLCDEVNGTEPWITDGTTEGTKFLANLNPTGSSQMDSPAVKMQGTYYMGLDDGIHGRTLWRSDGTAQGTVLLYDLNSTGQNEEVDHLTRLGDKLLFSAFRQELWQSDGSSENTSMIKKIPSSEIGAFASYHDKLYFIALDGEHGAAELWESSGTAEGTRFLLDIPDVNAKPRHLAFVGDTLYVALPNNTANTINIKKIDMQTTPLGFIDDYTINNAGVRWMGDFEDKLHLITINLTSYHSNIWKKEGNTYSKLALDIAIDFGAIQRFENLFLFNSFRFDEMEGSYMQLWKSDTSDAGTEVFIEHLCPRYSDS